MCYILYGALNSDVNRADYEKTAKGSKYSFKPGSKHDLKMCIVRDAYEYRVTDWVCDCDFPVGMKKEDAPELKQLDALLKKLRMAQGAQYVYLSKSWAGRKNKKEKCVHIDDMDVTAFLANMELDCLYRIDFISRETVKK